MLYDAVGGDLFVLRYDNPTLYMWSFGRGDLKIRAPHIWNSLEEYKEENASANDFSDDNWPDDDYETTWPDPDDDVNW